jgi:ubiquinone/menaquinone biosynthesis C-methylase UbiE
MQQRTDNEIPGLRLSGGEHQNLVDARFQSTALYWKEIYERDNVDAKIYQQRWARVLRLVDELGLPPHSHALEIGCGAGRTTVALAQRGYRVQAVDTVPVMIDLARQEVAKAGVGDRVATSLGDVHSLPFRDNVFSLVLAIGVASWLHSLDRAMREMFRVLKPHGYLVITAANRWSLDNILDPGSFPGLQPIRWKVRNVLEQFGLRKPGTEPRHHMYSITEFDAFLSAVRLEKMKGMTVGFKPFSFLNHQLLPQSVGVKMHQKLQSFADRGLPVIRSAGVAYIALAKKLTPKT